MMSIGFGAPFLPLPLPFAPMDNHFKAFGMAARDLAAAQPIITVTHAVEVAS